jgi:hypothetical protein
MDGLNKFIFTTFIYKFYIPYNTFQFEDESLLHKYFDVANFPYDFESDKKIDAKQVTVDGKMGNV